MLALGSIFAGETKNIEQLNNTLKMISDAGFSHIHWCHEWGSEYIYSASEMLQIRDLLQDNKLQIFGIHASEGLYEGDNSKFRYRSEIQNRKSYSSQNEYNRQAGVDLIKNRVDLAHILGATEIVLHMQQPYMTFDEKPSYRADYYTQVVKSFDELMPYCLEKNVRICLENCLGTPLHAQFYEFDTMFNLYPDNFLGLCFDTGHGNVVNSDCLSIARRYKNRLILVHLSDNHGLQDDICWTDDDKMGKCDEHQLPFAATFDWDGLAKILSDAPLYKLPCILETVCKTDDKEQYLKDALTAGNKFSSMVRK